MVQTINRYLKKISVLVVKMKDFHPTLDTVTRRARWIPLLASFGNICKTGCEKPVKAKTPCRCFDSNRRT